MHKVLLSLVLFLASAISLYAQGICDSTISIAPIQPICEGTGETYLQVSHPGGVFSGSGLIYGTNYLTAEFLSGGAYTATYTITGPGGCTVKATRQFQVRPAEYANAWATGQIDCSNPNSFATLDAFMFNAQNYYGGSWYGPPGSSVNIYGDHGTTKFAGTYHYQAYPVNFNDCPAYATVTVPFTNNQTPVKIANCTDCNEWNGDPPLRVKIDPVPAGWRPSLKSPNGAYLVTGADCTAIPFNFPEGIWSAEIVSDQNGCRSATSTYLNPAFARPSVSAGSDLALWCGGTGHLLPAMDPQNSTGFSYFWTTPTGSVAPSAYAQLLPVTVPGLYVLHGVNNFTGCEHRDTARVVPPPTPFSTQIAVICAGENLNGHTEPGTYVDSIPLANGCTKVVRTKLIVLAPLEDSFVVTPDNGMMTGGIQHIVIQGWSPFTYYWNTGETSSSLQNLSAGDYSVTITDANNCEHVRNISVPGGRPVQKQAADRTTTTPSVQTRLYPNPVTAGLTQVNLEIQSDQPMDQAILLLTDVLGRTVSTRTVQIAAGKTLLTLSETLTKGVYTVSLQGVSVSKLVVIGHP